MANEKRLIDAKKLFNDLADYWGIPRDWDGRMLQTCEDALSMIENATTVDAVEVVHGRNETKMHPVDEFICSECGCVCRDCGRYVYDEDAEDWSLYEFEFNYCPNCGAKMDGGNEDG